MKSPLRPIVCVDVVCTCVRAVSRCFCACVFWFVCVVPFSPGHTIPPRVAPVYYREDPRRDVSAPLRLPTIGLSLFERN